MRGCEGARVRRQSRPQVRQARCHRSHASDPATQPPSDPAKILTCAVSWAADRWLAGRRRPRVRDCRRTSTRSAGASSTRRTAHRGRLRRRLPVLPRGLPGGDRRRFRCRLMACRLAARRHQPLDSTLRAHTDTRQPAPSENRTTSSSGSRLRAVPLSVHHDDGSWRRRADGTRGERPARVSAEGRFPLGR